MRHENELNPSPSIFHSRTRIKHLQRKTSKLPMRAIGRAGKQTHFRIAILPVDVRGGSGCLGNQLALKCGAAPWLRPLYKYPYGFDVNTRQPENMMPLCKSTRVLCS